MEERVDLNKLREIVLKTRQTAIAPAKREAEEHIPAGIAKVVVHRGRINIVRDDADTIDAEEVAEVHPATFWAANSRIEREKAIVTQKFPPATKNCIVNEMDGWLYDIKDEYGQCYTLFAYYNDVDGLYYVKVVEPELEGKYSPHRGHLFRDGRICLQKPHGGLETLEQAYAKSVLWATGFSVVRLGYEFPF